MTLHCAALRPKFLNIQYVFFGPYLGEIIENKNNIFFFFWFLFLLARGCQLVDETFSLYSMRYVGTIVNTLGRN